MLVFFSSFPGHLLCCWGVYYITHSSFQCTLNQHLLTVCIYTHLVILDLHCIANYFNFKQVLNMLWDDVIVKMVATKRRYAERKPKYCVFNKYHEEMTRPLYSFVLKRLFTHHRPSIVCRQRLHTIVKGVQSVTVTVHIVSDKREVPGINNV